MNVALSGRLVGRWEEGWKEGRRDSRKERIGMGMNRKGWREDGRTLRDRWKGGKKEGRT